MEVRPLRQLTGEAEFNEVFLTDAVIPDADRIGAVGEGWRVATGTLMNERVSIGGTAVPREGGMIGAAARTWRDHPELRTPGLHDRMLRLWADAEVARLASERLRQQLAAGQPGPEGSAAKLVFARLNQEISAFEVELAGADGLRYDDWTMRRPEQRQLLRPRPGLPLPAVPRATRSRAAPRRSCATSSPSVCSACRPNPGTTPGCPGRTCPDERFHPGPGRPGRGGRCPRHRRPGLPDLLYSEAEEELRAAVRGLLEDRAGWRDGAGQDRDGRDLTTAACGRSLAAEIGCAGLLIPESRGGAGASYRETAVVAEETGRAAAPVPYLGSAVVATTAAAGSRGHGPAGRAGGRHRDGGAGRPVRGQAGGIRAGRAGIGRVSVGRSAGRGRLAADGTRRYRAAG